MNSWATYVSVWLRYSFDLQLRKVVNKSNDPGVYERGV